MPRPEFTSNENHVATIELRQLRHKYKAAYTSYMQSVQALSDASQKGEWPAADVLATDRKAFNDLAFVRQLLLDALSERRH